MQDKHTKICLYLDYYGSLLTKRRQQILQMIFEDDLSLTEIAENFEISRQAVHDNMQQGVQQLEQYEKTLGMVEKNLELRRLLDEILNNQQNLSVDLRQKLEEMKAIIL